MTHKIGFWTEIRNFPGDAYWSFLSHNALYILKGGYKACEVYDARCSGLTGRKVIAYAMSVIPYLFYARNKLTLGKAFAYSLVLPALALLQKGFVYYKLSRALIGERPTKTHLICSYAIPELDKPEVFKDQAVLHWKKTYKMTAEDLNKLKIKEKDPGHRLPQMNNPIYSVLPVQYEGISELSDYEDSYFDIEWKASYNINTNRMENKHFEVILSSKNPKTALEADRNFPMTAEDIVQLALIPLEPMNGEKKQRAISLRPEYVGSIFTYSLNPANFSFVRRTIVQEEYPRIPFNRATTIEDHSPLQLTFGPSYSELVEGEIWAHTFSTIQEYSNSVFLVKRMSDVTTIVRMLKPTHQL